MYVKRSGGTEHDRRPPGPTGADPRTQHAARPGPPEGVIDMKRNRRWIPLALAALVVGALAPAAVHAKALGVEVWTDRGDDAVYQPGDEMQVKVRASDDAYMIVYEIDSEGRVSLLYPWRRGSNMVEGHRTYRLPPDNSGYELAVEKATGEGYIVAIASRKPFRDMPWYLRQYDPQAEGNGYEDIHADEEGFDNDGKVVGDPMVAMERIRRRVLDQPSDTDDFATSYASYYVGHEVRYPRYLCADCHRPGRWAWWDGFDPYYARCSVFDFRVNWNWCWGPCIWNGYVPYYYYVVRPDCPPHYRGWYDDHSRWSAWDGHRTWDQLWGNSLVRYKSQPPVGYVAPPPPSTKPAWNPGGSRPPGYLPPSGTAWKRGGFRAPMPVDLSRGEAGRPTRPVGEGRQGPNPPRFTPPDQGRGRDSGDKPAQRPAPAYRPPRDDSPRQETPRVEPRREPRQEPRMEPRREPRQERPQRPPERRDDSRGNGRSKPDRGGDGQGRGGR